MHIIIVDSNPAWLFVILKSLQTLLNSVYKPLCSQKRVLYY